jgi:hypothetical protein
MNENEETMCVSLRVSQLFSLSIVPHIPHIPSVTHLTHLSHLSLFPLIPCLSRCALPFHRLLVRQR